MSAEEARTTYLEALFAKGFDYDFFPLTAVRYDAFIADWKEDDNKNAMPEKYRSDKRFGVISDIATLRDVDGRCEFWISIGWASGSISQRQSDDAGIKGKYLVAEVYIVNGLGEVETVQRGSDAFEDAFARLEMTLAFGFAERMNDADKGWFWVPPGRFLLNRKLRDSIVSTWRADFEARELKSDLCVMAALKHPPKFDDVEAQFRKPFRALLNGRFSDPQILEKQNRSILAPTRSDATLQWKHTASRVIDESEGSLIRTTYNRSTSPKINYNMKRAKLFTVTATAKIKGIKDRRNIRPLAEIKERIAYDPTTGTFTYRRDCDTGNAGEDAVWRCRRTDNVGTPYESTRYWELVNFASDHWYDPRKLAYYFVSGVWPPIDTWVAGGEKFDYTAKTLQLVASGEFPLRARTAEQSELNKPPIVAETRLQQTKKGLLARLFGL